MSTFHQFGNHPDPDQLNAFAEHILPEHERPATLAHLADCATCRQIVFLAQQALEQERSVAELPLNQVPWFRRWNLVWPVTAAVACTLVTVVLLHNVRTSHLPQQEVQNQPPIVAPRSQASSLQPITPKASPQTERLRSTPPHSAGTHGAHRPVARSTAIQPGNSDTGGQIFSSQAQNNLPLNGRNFQTLIPLQNKAAAEGNASTHGTVAAAPPLSLTPVTPSEANSADQSGRGQYASAGAQAQSFTQRAVTPTSPVPAASSQSTTVDVASAPIAIQTENATVTAGALDADTTAASPDVSSSLPSKLPTTSRLSNGHATVALDSAGGLFLSQDAGVRWQPITQTWSGKIIKIAMAPASNTEPSKAKTSRSSQPLKSMANLGGSRASSARQQVFAVTTDTGEIWISSDGFEWKKR